MDPNEVLEELRMYYNSFQDGTLTVEDAENMAVLFDNLDNWIIMGGFLPDEWRR